MTRNRTRARLGRLAVTVATALGTLLLLGTGAAQVATTGVRTLEQTVAGGNLQVR